MGYSSFRVSLYAFSVEWTTVFVICSKTAKITAGNVNKFNHVTVLWLSSKDNGFGFACFMFSNIMFSIKDLL